MITHNDIKKQYDNNFRKQAIFIPILILVLVVLAIYCTRLGTVNTSSRQVVSAVINGIKGNIEDMPDSRNQKIIFLLRVPRVLMAILAGVGLSISGTVMQNITKNPMVSPFTIGISSAAALGASIAIVFGISFFPGTSLGIVSNAFISAIICAILVYKISKILTMSPESIVLSGIAINYLFSALTSTIQFIADENKLSAALRWTFGSLNGITWDQVIMVFIVTGISIVYFMINSWKLNILSSGGDEVSKSMGINPEKLRVSIGVFSVLTTAVIVSFAGVIGFIGLVAPHIGRMIVGGDNRLLIPYSGIIGGFLLLLSDTIGRTIIAPVTIPVGIIISYLGVPLFVHLIIKSKKGEI